MPGKKTHKYMLYKLLINCINIYTVHLQFILIRQVDIYGFAGIYFVPIQSLVLRHTTCLASMN